MTKNENNNEKSLWLRVKVPVPPGTKGICDICHNLKNDLDLIGGPGDRTWTCPDCKEAGKVWLFGTVEGREMIRAIHKKKENRQELNALEKEKDLTAEERAALEKSLEEDCALDCQILEKEEEAKPEFWRNVKGTKQ